MSAILILWVILVMIGLSPVATFIPFILALCVAIKFYVESVRRR